MRETDDDVATDIIPIVFPMPDCHSSDTLYIYFITLGSWGCSEHAHNTPLLTTHLSSWQAGMVAAASSSSLLLPLSSPLTSKHKTAAWHAACLPDRQTACAYQGRRKKENCNQVAICCCFLPCYLKPFLPADRNSIGMAWCGWQLASHLVSDGRKAGGREGTRREGRASRPCLPALACLFYAYHVSFLSLIISGGAAYLRQKELLMTDCGCCGSW